MPTTQLQPICIPGKRRSFTAKEKVLPVRGTVGPFTALAVYAIPGARHSFSAKEEAPAAAAAAAATTTQDEKSMRQRRMWARRLEREDMELLEFITTIVTQGLLDQ